MRPGGYRRYLGLCRTGKDELLETAMALHDAAIKDEYFVKRRLAPNVDFWYVCPFFRLRICLLRSSFHFKKFQEVSSYLSRFGQWC
jgi:hypothetical protein